MTYLQRIGGRGPRNHYLQRELAHGLVIAAGSATDGGAHARAEQGRALLAVRPHAAARVAAPQKVGRGLGGVGNGRVSPSRRALVVNGSARLEQGPARD